MADQFERVARPSSSTEPGLAPPRGLNRNHLQLILTAIALLAGGAGAGITGYKWYTAEQHKTTNEGDQLQLEAEANRIFNEVSKNPSSHPILNEELKKLRDDLGYRPNSKIAITNYEWAAFGLAVQKIATPQSQNTLNLAQTQAAHAQTTNSQQDTEKKRHETVSAERDSAARRRFLNDRNIERLGSSADEAAGGGNTLAMPRGSMFDPPPISRGAPGSLGGRGQGRFDPDDPLKHRDPSGGDSDPFKQKGPVK